MSHASSNAGTRLDGMCTTNNSGSSNTGYSDQCAFHETHGIPPETDKTTDKLTGGVSLFALVAIATEQETMTTSFI